MKTTVMLTGAGMVGAQIIKLLHDEYGEKPAVLDTRFQWDYLDTVISRDEYVPLQGSVLDRPCLERAIQEMGIRRVLHTAAVLPMRVGHDAHPGFYEVNTWGTSNLLFTCADAALDRFVMFSTNGVYQFKDNEVTGPVTEDFPSGLSRHNSYGNSKAAAEYLLRELVQDGRIDAKIIRPGEIYGPVMNRAGDNPIYWAAMFNAAIEERPFVIKGHPEHRLDWVYAKDVARVATLALMADSTAHIEYHAASGRVSGVYDLLDALDRVFPGHHVRLENCGSGGWNYPLSMERAKRDFSFEPQFDLDAGLRDYAHWYCMQNGSAG
jgi:UDP-glucose 4-epimerase